MTRILTHQLQTQEIKPILYYQEHAVNLNDLYTQANRSPGPGPGPNKKMQNQQHVDAQKFNKKQVSSRNTSKNSLVIKIKGCETTTHMTNKVFKQHKQAVSGEEKTSKQKTNLR